MNECYLYIELWHDRQDILLRKNRKIVLIIFKRGLHIYIYICVCVCVCVCQKKKCLYFLKTKGKPKTINGFPIGKGEKRVEETYGEAVFP